MTANQLINHIQSGGLDETIARLYSSEDMANQRQRLCAVLNGFAETYGAEREVRLFSAPGRTEIGGNHTDHQRGHVLAAAVNLDVLCAAAPNGENVVRLRSEGYSPDVIELQSLDPRTEEKNTSGALVRGIVKAYHDRGYTVSGFDAYINSSVLKGSGLSSSAAFEVAIGAIISGLFNDGLIPPVELAKMGQYAENVYFGKPCGLMDQTASAVGGCVAIDFLDPENPIIEKVTFDLAKSGYTLCIVDTKGSHANLTHEYAAIPEEMHAVAAFFDKTHLRDVDEQMFLRNLPDIRRECGDRAALRAMHFFADNLRVTEQLDALKTKDIAKFLRVTTASGRSSACYLQNVFSCSAPNEQGLTIALALSERILENEGAFRVHGGGFAGTIQAFVPVDIIGDYKSAIESVFGADTCHILSIRTDGAIEIM